jgi:hypothetical protein
MQGSFVSLPHDMPTLSKLLPLLAADLADLVQITFIGSQMPTRNQLKRHCGVCKAHVMAALDWLCHNHPIYIAEMAKPPSERRCQFQSSHLVLDLPENDIPESLYQAIIHRFQEPPGQNPAMSSYVPDRNFFLDNEPEDDDDGELDCGIVVSGGVDGVLNSSKQQAINDAAAQHLESQLDRLRGNVQALRNSKNAATQQRLIMPHSSNPIDWWWNPESWVMAYFHLLPFGVGAPEAERDDPNFVSQGLAATRAPTPRPTLPARP